MDFSVKTPMTKSEIDRAKRELERRNELSLWSGFETKRCDPALWQFYRPDSVRGRQIYQSYSNEELLDVLIAVMDHPGYKPQLDRVHRIYKKYINLRFCDLSAAKNKARARRKALELERRWPPDWPENVSAEPLLRWMQEQEKSASEKDREIIEALCADASRTGIPPDLSSQECLQLKHICNVKKALEMMGIPPLNKSELRFMLRYWRRDSKYTEKIVAF